MNTCVIFCAGSFCTLAEPLDATDYIIAADGGLVHLQALELTPNMIIGDFDSLGYTPTGAQVFPVEKDDTDSMLAVRKGLALGYRRFVLYGALDGDRLDHTLANYQLLCYLADRGAVGYLAGVRYMVTALKDSTMSFSSQATGILSLFCLGADARGVTLTGLKYPLMEGSLSAAFPLGVSNHFTGSPATITVKQGTLLAMYDVENGFDLRGNAPC